MEFKNMNILRTTDYSLFKLHLQNRKINYKKVQKLAEAMKEQNLLSIYPIVVDKNNIILDGQHRYEAAKTAKVTVYFIVSPEKYDISKVPGSNNFQSHWRLEDYVNYYAKENKEPYKKLIELYRKYKVGVSTLASIGGNSKIYDQIKNGTYEFKDYDEVIDLIQHCKAIGIEYGFHWWNKRPFIRAMKHIINVTGYNRLRMGQKIMSNRRLLIKCADAEQYIKLLESIYNTNSIEQLRFL
jgi:hypothetical protein